MSSGITTLIFVTKSTNPTRLLVFLPFPPPLPKNDLLYSYSLIQLPLEGELKIFVMFYRRWGGGGGWQSSGRMHDSTNRLFGESCLMNIKRSLKETLHVGRHRMTIRKQVLGSIWPIARVKETVTWDLDWLKVMLMDRAVPGEEPLVVYKIFKCSFEF
jgi:hypothetical protein